MATETFTPKPWPERVRDVVERARSFVRSADEFPPEEVPDGQRWACGEEFDRLVDRMDMLAIEEAQYSLRVEAGSREAFADLLRQCLEAIETGATTLEHWGDAGHIRLIARAPTAPPRPGEVSYE